MVCVVNYASPDGQGSDQNRQPNRVLFKELMFLMGFITVPFEGFVDVCTR
jgi:hypothetical protein